MARVHTLTDADSDRGIRRILTRSLQSGHINYLIGSGASCPAVPIAGSIEQEIAALYEAKKVNEGTAKMYDFIASIQGPTNELIAGTADNADIAETVRDYTDYIGIIERILANRWTNILPKRATIFSTNYDLFIEKAALCYPTLRLNDGFIRVPNLDGRVEFSSRTFFTATSDTGNLYNYKVETPCINLIKLHGSFSWKKDGDSILYEVKRKELLSDEQRAPEQLDQFLKDYAVVLPQATKFRTTLMDRTYYELLRIFANELDRENVLLIAFGFSFGDEHIFQITKRALKNPTLRLVAFAFDTAAREALLAKFEGYHNVDIVAPEEGTHIDFQRFNELFGRCLPRIGRPQ